MSDSPASQSRRSLLRGISGQNSDRLGPAAAMDLRTPPSAGNTVRLSTRAMACDFSVIMNPGTTEQIESAGEALNVVHAIEDWLSIYRPSSDLSQLNQFAATEPQVVRGDLFELLSLANDLYQRTNGCFDMASGALTRLWKRCRQDGRIPKTEEVSQTLLQTGMEHVALEPDRNRVSFRRDGIILDPEPLGKDTPSTRPARFCNRMNSDRDRFFCTAVTAAFGRLEITMITPGGLLVLAILCSPRNGWELCC